MPLSVAGFVVASGDPTFLSRPPNEPPVLAFPVADTSVATTDRQSAVALAIGQVLCRGPRAHWIAKDVREGDVIRVVGQLRMHVASQDEQDDGVFVYLAIEADDIERVASR